MVKISEVNDMYEKAREIFKQIKKEIESKKFQYNVSEFEKAIQKLVGEYDTANWENRFVVGGALEVLFCALLNSMKFECKWLKEARYDIEINNVKFSLKSNFTGGGDIRLVNILGDKKAIWDEPTLFFIGDVGICYADPSMGLPTKHTSDALIVKTKDIKEMVGENDEWLISLSIPRKPTNSAKIKTASFDVAKSILEEINSRYLRKHLPQI